MVQGLSTSVKRKIDKVVWEDRHEICSWSKIEKDVDKTTLFSFKKLHYIILEGQFVSLHCGVTFFSLYDSRSKLDYIANRLCHKKKRDSAENK